MVVGGGVGRHGRCRFGSGCGVCGRADGLGDYGTLGRTSGREEGGLGPWDGGWLADWLAGEGMAHPLGMVRAGLAFSRLMPAFLSCGLLPPRCFRPCVFRDVEKGGSEKGWFLLLDPDGPAFFKLKKSEAKEEGVAEPRMASRTERQQVPAVNLLVALGSPR